MAPLLLFLVLTALWVAYLVVERIRLDRHLAAVPFRIAVTGTRGKTTVARLLTAVLAEDGRTVLAKTTGSEAAYLLPDGSTQEIKRRGVPSILEQKRLIRRGAKVGADVVVAEVMSVHAENHRVEASRLLRPHLVLATNFRVDHLEAHGATREDVASILALDVPRGSRSLVPEEEWEPHFAQRVEEAGGSVDRIPTGTGRPPDGCGEFCANLDLVWAAARSLGVSEEVIRRGVGKVQEDLGALTAWDYKLEEDRPPCLVVNAFAANDPESTHHIYDRVLAGQSLAPSDCIGLLCLRKDRGDRTLQWAEALREGALERYRRLFVVGLHARALIHRLRRHPGMDRITVLAPSTPEAFMSRILAHDSQESEAPRLLFGFGNMGGTGETLVRHWRKVGVSRGL